MNRTLFFVMKDFVLTLTRKSRWKSFLFWIGAILLVVLATIFYQPAAAKTGSLLVWMNNKIYIMDIDSLVLERVGSADAADLMVPSPGCLGQSEAPCWVMASESLYRIDRSPAHPSGSVKTLPVGEGFERIAAASWSPDGRHLAYSVFDEAGNQAELRVYNAATARTQTPAQGVDPAIAPAWTASCAAGLQAPTCELAFKTQATSTGAAGDDALPNLVALNPATGESRMWAISDEPIFKLCWTSDGRLLYSRPKRHFYFAEGHSPAYPIPAAGQLANMSPDAGYTVYYQPFTLADCQADVAENCMHLGVWLAGEGLGADKPHLIYDVNLAAPHEKGLNFVPVWAPSGKAFVFFQGGELIYYDLQKQEATIWYKSLRGKLRSAPVFSPNEEAVAFVDNQGQGFSEYRLLVINPRLQPVEHIIKTEDGFQILAWLPD